MQNIPKTIYLQIGEDCPTDDGEDFNAEIKESARNYWQNGNKLMAVKTVFPFCHSLKKSKEYCETNFNHK